jgi:hypothetical protein
MKTNHPPSHWIAVSLVTAAALLTLTEAWGQGAGAGAVFEGRPSMAGAQAGQGAMAGPPQGGIGLQGSEGTQLRLRRPAGLNDPVDMPQGSMTDPPPAVALSTREGAKDAETAPVQRDRDPGVAKKQRSVSDKLRRGAKRTSEAARYGVSPMDTR